MKKKIERQKMLDLLEKQSWEERRRKSKIIYDKLKSSKEYKNSKNLFIYVSTDLEVYNHDFIKEALLHKNIYIPHINTNKMEMYISKLDSFDDLDLGFYNILSLPEDKLEICDPRILDLVITPGVVFSKDFYRIGYGGGYYDKFFDNSQIVAKKLSLCYDFQVVDKVTHEDHDIQIDKIITEERVMEK